MPGIRGLAENGPHAGIPHRLFEFSGQFEALGRREITHQIGLLPDSADEEQALAFALHRFDDIFSPSAEADYGGVDHRWASDLVGRNVVQHRYSASCCVSATQ